MLMRQDVDTAHVDRNLLRLVRSRILRNRANAAQGQSGLVGAAATGNVRVQKRQTETGEHFFQFDISAMDGNDRMAP